MAQDQRNVELIEISAIMSTENGRNVISRLLQYTKLHDDTFHSDPLMHAYAAGKRAVGVHLVKELEEACPDLYIKLLRERIDEHR